MKRTATITAGRNSKTKVIVRYDSHGGLTRDEVDTKFNCRVDRVTAAMLEWHPASTLRIKA